MCVTCCVPDDRKEDKSDPFFAYATFCHKAVYTIDEELRCESHQLHSGPQRMVVLVRLNGTHDSNDNKRSNAHPCAHCGLFDIFIILAMILVLFLKIIILWIYSQSFFGSQV